MNTIPPWLWRLGEIALALTFVCLLLAWLVTLFDVNQGMQ